MNLTPAQGRAVWERGRDTIVTAGAGSGKTRVLVERYVSLLEDHEIDQLVAVTFTDAAAAEMRGRAREAVMTRPELQRHIRNVDDAMVGTVHSLCLQMLRDNPVEARIDPAVTVLSDDEAQVEVLTACRDAIETAAAGEGPGLEALNQIGIFQIQRSLPRMVERRNELERAFEAMGGKTPATWKAHVRNVLDEYVESLVAALRPSLELQLNFLVDAQDPEQSDSLTPIVEQVIGEFELPLTDDTAELLQRLQAVARIPSPGNRGTKGAWHFGPRAVRGAIRTLREAYGTIQPFQWNEADEDVLPIMESLRDLFRHATERYEASKQANSTLDFLDIELKAIALLKDSPRTAGVYRSRLRHVLVDEAQDLNPTQYEFLGLLAGGGDDSTTPSPERFFVGDVKQSIYRFRRGDVRNFNRLRTEIEERDGGVISLDTSFRSHERLVEAINNVMADVFGEATEEYEARMTRMGSVRSRKDGETSVEVLPIAWEFAQPEDAQPEEQERPRESQIRRMEADVVARRIKRLLDDGYLIWDSTDDTNRPAAPDDIVILMRSMLHVDEYERALENHGIPYRTMSGGNFFTRAEIIDLTNLLEWLIEPDNAIALVGLLRSPFFAIDDESLIALRNVRGSLLNALHNPPEGVLPNTRALCAHAARVLEQLQEDARLATPEQLLERALLLTNYEASWAPLRGGDQVLANIRQFLGIARTMAGLSVDEFRDYIRTVRDDLDLRVPQAALDAVNAVRLVTIHSAKGLEFPIVFLADAGANRAGSRVQTVLWRAEEGISATLEREVSEMDQDRRQPGFYSYLRELEKREDEAENKRLLYVAATRAADLLVVSGAVAAQNRDTWLGAFTDSAHGNHVNVSVPVPVDLRAIASRSSDRVFAVASASLEKEADAPLLGRRGAIPIRSSTPATALEHRDRVSFGGAPDQLARVRGIVAHAALEEWFRMGARPELHGLARRLDAHLTDEDVAAITADVGKMLDDFDDSELAATLRDQGTRKHFELPFSWSWDGIAVHGSIDLAYQTAGQWYVVDFKTDRVVAGRESERASAYLTQLGLYAGAVEEATGQRPDAGLLFLRTGKLYWADDAEIGDALLEIRRRINSGDVSIDETADADILETE